MRKFTRRNYVQDETGYQSLVQQRDAATHNLKAFLERWVAPAKIEALDRLVRELICTHQQTVSYQTEHEVDEADIDVY